MKPPNEMQCKIILSVYKKIINTIKNYVKKKKVINKFSIFNINPKDVVYLLVIIAIIIMIIIVIIDTLNVLLVLIHFLEVLIL